MTPEGAIKATDRLTIVIMPQGPAAPAAIVSRLGARGAVVNRIAGRGGSLLLTLTGPASLAADLRSWPECAAVHAFAGSFGLVTREIHPENTVVPFGTTPIGGGSVVVIAGPCGVESRTQLLATAVAVREAGGHGLRGGAFKPRTSPYSFQGLGKRGLELLAEARALTGLPVATEVVAPEDVPLVSKSADMLQVGARNMQNFRLLEAVGLADRPVMLKRGMAATIDELLAAAEYVYTRGNTQIVLCERGIKGGDPRLRNTLDLATVVLLKRLTHLPVIVDPSHATGLRELVPDLARAAVAAGADGLLIEVHPSPETALSDGRQSLRPEDFAELMTGLEPVARAIGRSMARSAVRQSPAST